MRGRRNYRLGTQNVRVGDIAPFQTRPAFPSAALPCKLAASLHSDKSRGKHMQAGIGAAGYTGEGSSKGPQYLQHCCQMNSFGGYKGTDRHPGMLGAWRG
eukprot:1161327-Pelagomonas_calceolata.AAC.5